MVLNMLADSLFVHTFMLLIISESMYGCRFGAGQNCAFPCNCKNNGCDEETGDCSGYGGCKSVLPVGYGWDGPGCLVGNVAYARNSSQSSMISIKNPPSLGNDGNNNCGPDHYIHTEADNPAWYKVNLGNRYRIINVTLYDRGDWIQDRLIGSKIQIIDNTLVQDCVSISDINHNQVMTFTCNMIGDSVRIYRDMPDSIIHICELVVMGHPYIYRTFECKEWENDVVGCKTCQVGKKLPECSDDCPSGYYGVNCQGRCSTNCKSGPSQICDPLSGRCRGGCQGWYVGDNCYTEIYELRIFNVDISDNTTSSSITITWTPNTPLSTGNVKYYHYMIRYREKSGPDMATPEIPLTHTLATDQSYTIGNLESDTEYEYVIRTVRTVGNMSDFYESSLKTVSTLKSDDSSGVTNIIISDGSIDISVTDIPIPSKFNEMELPHASANDKTCAKLCALEERSVVLINAAISMIVVSVIIAVVAIIGAMLYVKRARQKFKDKTSVPLPLSNIAHTAAATSTTSSDQNYQDAAVYQDRYQNQSTTETENQQYYNMRSQNGIVDYEDVGLAVGPGSYEKLNRTNIQPASINTVYQTLD